MATNLWFFLGSAGIGALVSSLINGLFNYLAKIRELERRDLELCLELARMKHQQLVVVQDWAGKGAPLPVKLWDPLVSVIEYRRGLDEFRKTGGWEKGEASHEKTMSDAESGH